MTISGTPITWRCALYELDVQTAKFSAGTTGCRLELPALEWVGMGRPGVLEITPIAPRDEADCTCGDTFNPRCPEHGGNEHRP